MDVHTRGNVEDHSHLLIFQLLEQLDAFLLQFEVATHRGALFEDQGRFDFGDILRRLTLRCSLNH